MPEKISVQPATREAVRQSFWDGRANDVFNGSSASAAAGMGDGSAASQSVGPPLAASRSRARAASGTASTASASSPARRPARSATTAPSPATRRCPSRKQRGLINNDGGDQGFHNTGVRPTHEDLGRAGLGPNGAPWSQSGSPVDRGAFKTPGLRNLKLTAPYFHKGGTPTIAAVVDFYARGGDFKNPELSKDMKHISLSTNDKSDLVAFLTNALTDCRSSSTRRGSTIRRCRSPRARTCPPPACRDWGL
jgi:cytochrome c peroxidase